ncbi:hypothetical protein Tco_0724154 [Tanacetum coccineum]
METAKGYNRDRSDDEDRYRRRSGDDRYRSERGGQDRRISNRSDEEDKDGRKDHYRNMDRDRRTDDKRQDISKDDSRRRDRSRSKSVSSDEEGANEKRRDKTRIKGLMVKMIYVVAYIDDTWILWDVRQQRLYKSSAGKTWYGVLRDSVMAFEVVVRFHRYGGEINPIGSLCTCNVCSTSNFLSVVPVRSAVSIKLP